MVKISSYFKVLSVMEGSEQGRKEISKNTLKIL